jgi:hypothetical protein
MVKGTNNEAPHNKIFSILLLLLPFWEHVFFSLPHSQKLGLCSSLNVRNQASCPHKIKSKIAENGRNSTKFRVPLLKLIAVFDFIILITFCGERKL